jgi:hypothetical protein
MIARIAKAVSLPGRSQIDVTAIRRNSILLQCISERRYQPPLAKSWDLAQAANAPGQAAAGAANATDAANDPDPAATESAAASAPGATPASAATMEAATTMAAAATTMAAATATAAGELHAAAANIFPVEEVERGEADVGHFLFAQNEAMIGQALVGLRDIGSRHRRCRCATDQRKTQSGGTQHTDGRGFACAFWRRSLLDPWHDRILQNERLDCAERAPTERSAQELPQPKTQNIS